MRIQEILLEKKHKKHRAKKHDVKHHDDAERDEVVPDAEEDKVPLITMQALKALDVQGNYPLTFKDGSKAKLGLQDIKLFLHHYMAAKPSDKELMQDIASQSPQSFYRAIARFSAPAAAPQKIKGTRYMSHFSGDHDDK